MTTFRCEKFPEGRIRTTAGIVPFSGGLAVVDDPEVAQALRAVPEVFGVTEVTEPPAPETCPLCGARQNVQTPPQPSTPDSGSVSGAEELAPYTQVVDQAVAQLAEETGTPVHLLTGSGDGTGGQGDDGVTGEQGQDDGAVPPVALERPADSATRGDWLVYVSAVLGRPQSDFKGVKLPDLKALVPNQ